MTEPLDDARVTVTIFLPSGYATGNEFAADCGFEIAAPVPQCEAEPEIVQRIKEACAQVADRYAAKTDARRPGSPVPRPEKSQLAFDIATAIRALIPHATPPSRSDAGSVEAIARVLYECEKRRATNADAVIKGAFPKASDALLMEPWEDCKDCFLSDAQAVLTALVPPPSEAGREAREKKITRLATIEECAQVADDLANWFGERQAFLAEDAVDDCARKIRALSPDPGTVAVASGAWTPEQFWEYAEGLTDAFTCDQLRSTMTERGLAISSTHHHTPTDSKPQKVCLYSDGCPMDGPVCHLCEHAQS